MLLVNIEINVIIILNADVRKRFVIVKKWIPQRVNFRGKSRENRSSKFPSLPTQHTTFIIIY